MVELVLGVSGLKEGFQHVFELAGLRGTAGFRVREISVCRKLSVATVFRVFLVLSEKRFKKKGLKLLLFSVSIITATIYHK